MVPSTYLPQYGTAVGPHMCYKLVELPATSPSPPDRGGDARVLVTVEAKTAAL